MTTKFKILSAISFIAMAIVVTFVGVWAITDLDFSVGGDITYPAPEPKGPIITMGEYQGEQVEWKLIAVDGVRYTGDELPTSGVGTFFLQTASCTDLKCAFDIELETDDYAQSDIREYLKNQYLSTLNLNGNEIYNKITPRTVADMYIDIGWNTGGNSNYDANIVYSISTTNKESDKLWLLSAKEVYEWVGGGVINSKIIPYTWSDDIINNVVWDGDCYYTRTPYYNEDWCRVVGIFWDGAMDFSVYNENDCAPRPAFNIDLSLL